MTYLLIGLLLGVLGVGWFGFERQRQAYQLALDMSAFALSEAKQETKVYRGLLFPVLNRAEGVSAGAPAQPGPSLSGSSRTTIPGAPAQAAPTRRIRSHVPFRTLFNQARKATNTSQIKTDALAAALEFQKAQTQSQEKNHVS